MKGSSQNPKKARDTEWKQEPSWPQRCESQTLTDSISRHERCDERPSVGFPSLYNFPKTQIPEDQFSGLIWVGL